ncbi:hypothetical protein [uncultured Tenacibaculum sp.]|uniref:hypothetical protein n=1 Tax=uncultured Tenacibaculum sp. TaxID=174713 RepID=UPI0026370EF8|nr:hypothetical protein [uncultured Tenacibaculum sp.]
MQKDSFENQIREKFRDRTLTPSNSAWERLSNKLDEQEQNKRTKKKYRFLLYAASLVLLIGLGFSFFLQGENSENIEAPNNIIVVQDNIPTIILEKETEIKNQIKEPKEVIQDNKEEVAITKPIQIKKEEKLILPDTKEIENVLAQIPVEKEKPVKEQTDKILETKAIIKTNKRILVNPDDLLYAVTHTPQEVQAYYAKYNINRNSIIDTVQQQLKKSNLKVDPESILAEIELSIQEDDFKENFMHKFKLKLTDVIVAIVDRNN